MQIDVDVETENCMQSVELPNWNDESLGPGPIAITPHPALQIHADGANWPALIAWAPPLASPQAIAVDQVGHFLAVHPDAQFVCAGAVGWYWQLHDALRDYCGDDAASQLHRLVEKSRLVDLPLLDQLLRHARGEIAPDIVQDLAELQNVWSSSKGGTEHLLGSGSELDELRRLIAIYNAMLLQVTKITSEATAPIEPSGQEADADWDETTDLVHNGPLGVGCQLRGGLALARCSARPGLRVDQSRRATLLQRAQTEYADACDVLDQIPDARECFVWNGTAIALNEKFYPRFHWRKLKRWLQRQSNALADQYGQSPSFVRVGNGGRCQLQTINLEHWGVWAACSQGIWACRQVFRMAEVARLADVEDRVRPQYELVPRLRSREPNLRVYRQLGVPVFRPSEGRVFLAGKVLNASACCLAAVSVRSGYAPEANARLPYLLDCETPLDRMACELYVAQARTDVEGQEVEAVRPDQDHLPRPAAHLRAEFAAWKEDRRDPYEYWLAVTAALLQVGPLGLPPELLTAVLRNEYGFTELNEPAVRNLLALLGNEVVYELAWFLGDGILERLAAREGMTIRQAIRHHAFRQETHRSNSLLRGKYPDVAAYRRLTLAGRPTIHASQPIVRAEELLMAVDEVMLEVAWAVSCAGYTLVAVAGDEFLIEIDAELATHACLQDLAQIASAATGRVLGQQFLAGVNVNQRDDW